MVVRAAPLRLNGKDYAIARDKHGALLWTRQQVTADERDLFPQQDRLPLGHKGMGSSVPAVPGQFASGKDTDTTESVHYAELWPGMLQTKLGLALDKPVVALAPARDAGKTTGPNSAAFAASNSTGAGVTWSNPTNAQGGGDTVYAVASGVMPGHPTHDLKATNYGFAGGGAVSVNSVDVFVKGKWDGNGGTIPRVEARLVIAGTIQTVVGVITGHSTTDTELSVNISTGLPTAAQARLSTFGAAIRIVGAAGATSAAAFSVDTVRITVNWNTGAEGPFGAGTVADDTSISQIAWVSPGNITASDGAFATAALGASAASEYLFSTIYGFTLPSDATKVVGVTVEPQVKWDGAGGTAPTVYAKLIIADAIQSNEYKSTTITTTLGYKTLGGGGDRWSNTPTVAQVNSSGPTYFGVAIYAVGATGATGTATVQLDHVRITVTTAPFGKYLYAVGGNQLSKHRLTAMGAGAALGQVEAKTFTHSQYGSAGAEASDIVTLKDGPQAQASSDALMLIGFGETGQVQQIDTIAYNAADSYRALAASPAYAGVFALGATDTATEARVFKSVGFNNGATGPGRYGAFSQLQNAAIAPTSTDYTAAATWTPATPYQVGTWGDPVNRLVFYQRGIVGGKRQGALAFDAQLKTFELFSTAAYQHDDNGKVLLPWGRSLLVGTSQDLMIYPSGDDPAVGLSSLVANQSSIYGRPVAAAAWGRWLFVAFYRDDTGDSYICKARARRADEEAPHPLTWWPVTTVTGHKVQAMLVTDDGSANAIEYLFYGCASATAGKYDVGWCILGPQASKRYATGGTHDLTTWGDPAKRRVLQRVTVFGRGFQGGDSWQLACSWDDGAFNNIGVAVSANGRAVVAWTPGTNDNGYLYQLRWTCTNGATTHTPRLYAPGGALVVDALVQPDQVMQHTITLALGTQAQDGQGGRIAESPLTQTANLVALSGPTGASVLAKHLEFGDENSHRLVVKKVEVIEGPKETQYAAERYARVTLSELLNG